MVKFTQKLGQGKEMEDETMRCLDREFGLTAPEKKEVRRGLRSDGLGSATRAPRRALSAGRFLAEEVPLS